MRSLALLLVLMAAFYVLLSDDKTGVGKGKKTSNDKENKPAHVEGDITDSYFEQGLPQDFMPKDITHYGSVNKLIDDLDYRRMRMHHQFDSEVKEFRKTHDKDGKDKKAYQNLLKKHKEAREEFKMKYVEQIKEYRKMKVELYETNDKGLR